MKASERKKGGGGGETRKQGREVKELREGE